MNTNNQFNNMTLRTIIKTLCKQNNMKMIDLARELDLNYNSLKGNITNSRPNYRTLVKMAKYFDIDVDILDNAPLR